jgi:hypothetical protein
MGLAAGHQQRVRHLRGIRILSAAQARPAGPAAAFFRSGLGLGLRDLAASQSGGAVEHIKPERRTQTEP